MEGPPSPAVREKRDDWPARQLQALWSDPDAMAGRFSQGLSAALRCQAPIGACPFALIIQTPRRKAAAQGKPARLSRISSRDLRQRHTTPCPHLGKAP
jgi:hypothetical protein